MVRRPRRTPRGSGSRAVPADFAFACVAVAGLAAYALFALAWPVHRLAARLPAGATPEEAVELARIDCLANMLAAIPDGSRVEYVGDTAIDQRIVELGYPRLQFTGPALPTHRVVTPAPSTTTGTLWTCGERSYEVAIIGR